MREAWLAKAVGAFVLSAGVLAAVALVGVGLRQGWIAPRRTLWTVLDSAEHVRLGDPVTLAGLTVGEVDRLVLTDDLRIAAALKVERRPFAHLREGTVARVEPPLLIGSGKISLLPSRGGARLASGDTIPSSTARDLGALVLAAERILWRADSIAASMHELSAQLLPLAASVGHPDSAFRRSLRASADLLEAMAGPGGFVPSLVEGPLRTADSALASARAAAEELRLLLERLEGLAASSDSLLASLDALAEAASEATPRLRAELVPLLRELRLTLEQMRASRLLGGSARPPAGPPGAGRMAP